jgi:two-component system NtrC family sensor kinase
VSERGSEATRAALLPTVLIVDDREANLRLLEELLSEMDCELVRATSGNEALRLLLKREFALMLLDVHMPEMDGYEVANLVRQQPANRNMPIVFVTATLNSDENLRRAYGSGAVDFLLKPIDPIILRSKVRVFLDLYSSRRSLERAYQQLQQMQGQLIQSAKMSSLGQLVAGIAHEINNPLAFASSHLDTARDQLTRVEPEIRGALSEPALERWSRALNRLSEMSIGLERIRDLVLKLRTFSRLDEGERKLVDVRECIDSVLTIFGHRLRGRIQLDVDVAEPSQLDCYPALFNQALANLVSNAIDAISGEGQIRISTRRLGREFVLAVADSGTGIPEELRARVFDPFFTTKPVGQGTGLGLSITYSIVQKHGGTLEIADAPEGGTVMSMRVPLGVPEGEPR